MKNLLTGCAMLAIAATAAGCSQAAPSAAAPQSSVRQACHADIVKFCSDIDRTQVRDCVKAHADQFSAPCKAAIAARRAAGGGGGGGGMAGGAGGAPGGDQ